MDLDSLIARFRGPLIGLFASWGASARDAQELAQDVFAQAYLSRERFDGSWEDAGAAGAWLRGIASKLHLSHRRKGPRKLDGTARRELAHEKVAEPASCELEAREHRAAVREALGRLRESWRTVLYLHYLEGSALAEIAGLLGISERSVEGRLHRARKELKRLLAGGDLVVGTSTPADGTTEDQQ